uniref:Proton_antipo_M domain-containing protein n=1 Tax=Globodera pallida TaxID=36090 RepID=A0A183C3X7_GLOPA
MAFPSDTVVLLAYTFFSFEFVTDIFVLAIACLNLAVIGPTKLLHPNLKFILITQSVAVVLFVLVRSAMLVPKFISTDYLFTPANLILQSVIVFEKIFRRILGHALIIERVVATFIIAFNLVSEGYQISLAFAFFAWTDTMLGAAIELTVIT